MDRSSILSKGPTVKKYKEGEEGNIMYSGAGGAGGGGAGFRTAASSLADGGFQPFAPNEKLELQTLNDRLAAYLDKVKKLELANHELEEKLRGFTANKVQVTYDFQAFQCQLQPLRDQIADFLKEISRLTLSIDNAGLAADDYRVKFENEATVRQTVEAEIAALKALKRDHELTTATLTQEYEILQKDRDVLQTTHKQEVQTLRGQMAGTLTVDVQAENSVDLSRRLSELRSEYENIVAKNHGEIEAWYSSSVRTRVKETAEITEVTVSGSAEITSSRSEILTLQTDLDALLLQKSQLEQRLVEVQGQKQTQLLTLSRLAANLEGELASVRENALQQAHDYQLLLSTKVQLEKEITSYKSLLEFSEDLTKFPGVSSSLSQSLVGKSAFTKVSLSGSISGEGGASAGGASTDVSSGGITVSSGSDDTKKETAVST
ncbi:keratin, type I cytoskeletal 13-like [Hoplias malabaricus]|uniref:keratin, type I cytoskeletal 13-like n=1 Tax=Hoplias malabaricus TaxID=27720 RepID=UPI003463631E